MKTVWMTAALTALAFSVPFSGNGIYAADVAVTGQVAKEEYTMKKVTAGRDTLGMFAPQFAALNDDVLFGQVWSRTEELPLRERSMVTVTALVASGVTDSSLRYHIETAHKNGVTKEEMAELLTQVAFYAGWPKAWAAFRMAKEVYEEG